MKRIVIFCILIFSANLYAGDLVIISNGSGKNKKAAEPTPGHSFTARFNSGKVEPLSISVEKQASAVTKETNTPPLELTQGTSYTSEKK